MEQAKIDRINELARKAKSEEGLTPAEMVERDLLRQEYIAAYRDNLIAQLETPTSWSPTAPSTSWVKGPTEPTAPPSA